VLTLALAEPIDEAVGLETELCFPGIIELLVLVGIKRLLVKLRDFLEEMLAGRCDDFIAVVVLLLEKLYREDLIAP
jgi:hypothetical protein